MNPCRPDIAPVGKPTTQIRCKAIVKVSRGSRGVSGGLVECAAPSDIWNGVGYLANPLAITQLFNDSKKSKRRGDDVKSAKKTRKNIRKTGSEETSGFCKKETNNPGVSSLPYFWMCLMTQVTFGHIRTRRSARTSCTSASIWISTRCSLTSTGLW